MSDDFIINIQAFVDRAKANADIVVQKLTIELNRSLVLKSPVGNPELWAANQSVVSFNNQAAETNAALRMDPANLTKAGRLRKGIKRQRQRQKLKAPPGYIGGRFRMNWQVTLHQPATGTLDDVDPTGAKAIAAGMQIAAQAKAGDVVYIVNNLPYAHRLEFEGHSSKQAPAGMLRITVVEFNQFLNAAVRQIPEK